MSKIWLLLIVPLVLGCIGGGDDTELSPVGQCIPEIQDGLVVNNFYPDLYDVYSDEGLILTLEVENYGSSEATKVEAELFNLGGFNIDGTTVIRLSDMEVPEPDMPPITDEADWSLTAPEFGTSTTREIEIGGALSYDYSSQGHAYVVFIPTDEWRKMRQEGATTVDVEQDCSDGPVGVSVEPLRQPATDTREFTLRVVLSNLGGGKVESEHATNKMDWIDEVTMTLPDELEVGSTCSDFPTADGNKLMSGQVKLTRGSELTLNCKLRLKDSTQTVRQAKYKVDVRADYRYTVEDRAYVQVTEEAHSLTLSNKGAESENGDMTWTINDASAAETFVVTLDPRYDGSFDASFLTVGLWSGSFKNDLTVAKTLTVASVERSDPDTDSAGYNYVNVTFKNPGEDLNDKYIGADKKVTLTAKMNYLGRRASARIDGITLAE